MNTFIKTALLSLITFSLTACCDRRCAIQESTVQKQPQPNIQYKLEKVKAEKGDK